MSYTEDQLRKVLGEIEAKAIASQREIAIVKQAMSQKSRQARSSQLTTAELSALPAETAMYEGLGKAFVLTPREDVLARVAREKKEADDDTAALEKKLHYLQTTFDNARSHLQAAMAPR